MMGQILVVMWYVVDGKARWLFYFCKPHRQATRYCRITPFLHFVPIFLLFFYSFLAWLHLLLILICPSRVPTILTILTIRIIPSGPHFRGPLIIRFSGAAITILPCILCCAFCRTVTFSDHLYRGHPSTLVNCEILLTHGIRRLVRVKWLQPIRAKRVHRLHAASPHCFLLFPM